MSRVAIVGEGVIGISTALAIQQRVPKAKITIFHDKPFEATCSYGPAGLFRIDNVNWQENREYGRATFDWYAKLSQTEPGSRTGVKLLSGHIQSDDRTSLETQEKAYGDIVYNFRWLSDREMKQQFKSPSKYCIHFSAYGAEGNLYVPYLKSQLKNAEFVRREVKNLSELGSDFDVVVNCAGLRGGSLAGDDVINMSPIRGVILQVHAPWQKHFLYRDYGTFCIPKQDSLAIGSVKQDGNYDTEIHDDEVRDILNRFIDLHPAMKDVKIESTWCGLRPSRKSGIRVEKQTQKTPDGQSYTVVHHYGHGGGGFTLGRGSSQKAAELVENALIKSKI